MVKQTNASRTAETAGAIMRFIKLTTILLFSRTFVLPLHVKLEGHVMLMNLENIFVL